MISPTFGEKLTTIDYKAYHGIHTAIPSADKSQIILVQAPNGSWSPPGREVEAGENHFSALKRKLIEELGFSTELGYYHGRADEYFYSRRRDTYFYDPAYIYEVAHFEETDVPLEDFNNLSWFPIGKAIEELKHGDHR